MPTKRKKIKTIYKEIGSSYFWCERDYVLIWNVLDWVERKNNWFLSYEQNMFELAYNEGFFDFSDILSNRKEKREPIEEQEDSLIDFIFNLTQQWKTQHE